MYSTSKNVPEICPQQNLRLNEESDVVDFDFTFFSIGLQNGH